MTSFPRARSLSIRACACRTSPKSKVRTRSDGIRPAEIPSAIALSGAPVSGRAAVPSMPLGKKLRRVAFGRSCIRLKLSNTGGPPRRPTTATAPNGFSALMVSRSVAAPTTSRAASTPSGKARRTSSSIRPRSTMATSAPTSRRRRTFCLRAGRRDDLCAETLRVRSGGQPERSRRTANEESLPLREAETPTDRAPDSQVRLGQRRELLPGQGRSVEVDHVAAQDRDFLGVASGPRELHSAHRGGDSLARAEGSGRVRDDLAGGFDARHRRAVDGAHHAGPAIYL